MTLGKLKICFLFVLQGQEKAREWRRSGRHRLLQAERQENAHRQENEKERRPLTTVLLGQ